jgi:hypothetical protein
MSDDENRESISSNKKSGGLRVPPNRFAESAARHAATGGIENGSALRMALVKVVSVIVEIFKAPRQRSVVSPDTPLSLGLATGPVSSRKSITEDVREAKKLTSAINAGKNYPIVVPPVFKMAFLTVVAITVLAGVTEIILAGRWTEPTANQQSAFEAMGFAWKAGIGAIFGLLGGKVT